MKKKISKIKYKQLEENYITLIEKRNITFIDELFIYSDIQPSVFFDNELNKSQKIKDKIEINRSKLKKELREKWLESTNATLNVALYKLICTEEERKSLSSSASTKTSQTNDICTQEEYLKSLKEMSEGLENADWLDKIKIQ